MVHLESNELGFKEQSKIPIFFPSLTLLKYLASNELISDLSLGLRDDTYWQIHNRMLFCLETM